jgi:hypothetical protein
MPGRREEQLALAKKWIVELPNSQGKWQVSDAEISEIEDLVGDVENALRRQMENPGPVETARVREAFKAVVHYMRWLHGRKFLPRQWKTPTGYGSVSSPVTKLEPNITTCPNSWSLR